MNTQSIEARLCWLEDNEALRKLIARYQQSVDALDWPNWAATFAEDGTCEFVGLLGPLHGRQAILEASRAQFSDFKVQQHAITNLDFDIDGDSAAGKGDLLFAALPDPEQPATAFFARARYNWKFTRTEEGWRIADVKAEFVWMSGTPG